MNKYEISLWEDFKTSNGIDERKICTLGNNEMTSWTRAREPKMVENINGTHTFSFKMFYNYIDEITGETVPNPFCPYLINERKVKVFWQDNWYDLIIKSIDEDSSGNGAVYTCKDVFITELSKNGYNIELTSDLQNNSGTASDLVERVLDGSGWRFDSESSDKIYQYLEQPVYEITISGTLSATKISPNGNSSTVSIPNGAKILVLKSSIDQVLNTSNTNIELHFIYAAGGSYQTEYGEMLVINGDEYYINTTATKVSNGVQVNIGNTSPVFNTISSNYRAKGLVQSQKSVYDPLFERYVNVYNDKSSGNKVYGFQTTEFSKPTTVTNLIANSSNFKNTSGWIGEGLTWEVYPSNWSSIQDLTNYSVTGYLKVPSGPIYNNGISANLNLLQPTTSEIKNGETGGFHIGDKFIFRAKVKNDLSSGYIKDNFEFQVCEFNNDYSKKGNSYFNSVRINPNSDWYEAELTCTSSCPATELEKLGVFFINNSGSVLYIEDIQFFKDVQGSEDVINYYTKSQPQLTLNINEANGNTYSFYKDSEVKTLIYLIGIPDGYTVEPGTGNGSEYWPLDGSIRLKANQSGTTVYNVINMSDNIISTFTVEVAQESYQPDYIKTTKTYIAPGEINLQGVASVVYKYYNANQEKGILPEEVNFLYIGEEESSDFEPVTTYEKITTVEAKGSNRFNILQSIAENFQCWVRFTINHDSNGKISLDADGLPEKYITLVSDLGVDLGWSFIYGIDLKAIKRKIISEDIVTKTIVLDNNNEFGKNGFCSIARSPLNYARENFILNFDYYVKAGLLDKDEVEADLYGSSGYLTKLNDWNTQYIESVDTLVQKKMELDKQSSELEVLTKRNKSIAETITSNESDVMKLLNIDSFAAAAEYLEENPSNKKINSLIAAIGQLRKEQKQISDQLEKLEASVNNLQTYVTDQEAALQAIISTIKNLHNEFFKKYSRYIQEGTWQSEDYVDDNKYYLDAMEVAHTSAFPKVQYDINVIRVNALEEFSSKKFSVGDICYIQDKDFFNFVTEDGNPYKLQIVISEITSYFDSPEKDAIKVQNYKTQFEDLFQRITATTQSLQYSQGSYAKAAGAFNSNGDLKFNLLQETFDNNASIVMNASNQDITWDSTGITIKDSTNSAQLLRIMSGGLFVSNDGGLTWKNAVRGDGISTDVLTAGRINTGEIFILNDDSPTFRWDSNGINAYSWTKENGNTVTDFNKYVRFDQYGLYGYTETGDGAPTGLDDIIENGNFGLTWDGFFMNSISDDGSVRIDSNNEHYVIQTTDGEGKPVFTLKKDGSLWITGSINYGSEANPQEVTVQELLDGGVDTDELKGLIREQYEEFIENQDDLLETYYYDYEPENTNYPASAWTTNEERSKHVGDLFYNKLNGQAYRYSLNNEFIEAIQRYSKIYKDKINIGLEDDKKIVIYYGNYSPIASENEEGFVIPSIINWNDLNTKKSHCGDLFCKKTSGLEVIYYYIKDEENNDYKWEHLPLQNTDIIKAIIESATDSDTQETGNPNRRVFITSASINEISTPYSQGDFWIKGYDYLRCITSKTSTQSYSLNDWEIDSSIEYKWDLIKDSQITQALSDASTAVAAVDGKISAYYGNTEPSNPSEGDIWFDGTDIKIYVNNDGTFAWQKQNKYLDSEGLTDIITERIYDFQDPVLETYFGDGEPSPSTIPEMQSWTGIEVDHFGDLYYNRLNGDIYRYGAKGDFISLVLKYRSLFPEELNVNTGLSDKRFVIFYSTSERSWNDDVAKNSHRGELWYNINTKKVKYYTLEDGVYKWKELLPKYQYIINAVARSYGTIYNGTDITTDETRRIFISDTFGATEITPPYNKGDIWISNNQYRVCNIGRGAGASFFDSDWTNSPVNITYNWYTIDDDALSAALKQASQALSTVDDKIKCYYAAEPEPPYDPGDIWFNGEDILVCIAGKTDTQDFSSDDWVKRDKYINTLTLPQVFASYLPEFEDENLDTWFGEGDPTGQTKIYPETTWTDYTTKASHSGDLYYNKKTGKVYRYELPNKLIQAIQKYRLVFYPLTSQDGLKDNVLTIYYENYTPGLDATLPNNLDWESTKMADHKGDLLYDRNTKKVYYYKENNSSYTWEPLHPINNQLLIERIQSSASSSFAEDGVRQIFITSSTEGITSQQLSDIWIDSSNNIDNKCKIYRTTGWGELSDGSLNYVWVELADNELEIALRAASSASAALDGKVAAFYQSDEPTTGMEEGDLWFSGSEIKVYLSDNQGHLAWVRYEGYTDDTTANAIANGQYQSTIQNTFINERQIKSPEIIGGTLSIGSYTKNNTTDYHFKVDSDGNVTMDGGITLAGNITWGGNASVPINNVTGLGDQLSNITTIASSAIRSYSFNHPPEEEASINWEEAEKSQHIGNLYYDRSTGFVYRYELSNKTVETLQKYYYSYQLDNLNKNGKFIIYYLQSNNPGGGWTIDGSGENSISSHIGDLYYRRNDDKVLHFVKTINSNGENEYNWVEISTDSFPELKQVIKNYKDSGNVTSDYNRRIFISSDSSKVVPPYSTGDLWIKNDNTYSLCKVNKSSGSFDSNDWGDSQTGSYEWNRIIDQEVVRSLNMIHAIASGTYTGGTFINGNMIYSPEIMGGTLTGTDSLKVGYNSNYGRYNLEVDNEGQLFIGPQSSSGDGNYKFKVDKNGNVFAADYFKVGGTYGTTTFTQAQPTDPVTANNLIVDGTIYARAGDIGGWKIATDSSKALYYSTLDTTGITSAGTSVNANNINGENYKFFKTTDSVTLLTISNIPSGYAVERISNSQGSDVDRNSIKSISNQTGTASYQIINSSDKIHATFTVTIVNEVYKISSLLSPFNLPNNLSVAGSPSKKDWRLVVGDNFGVDSTGTLYAGSGTINAGSVVFEASHQDGKGGGFRCSTGGDGTGPTYGAMMYGWPSDGNIENVEYYFIATNAGVRMTATANSEIFCTASEARINSNNVYINGTAVATNSGPFTGSDRNKKHDISYNIDKYLSFYNSLKPAYFKLNDGTSNRYHIGFIAQDVEAALLENNLTTQDFAGFGILKFNNEPEYQALRYEEFISLNTYMIQKLMKQIEDLQQEIENLKQ